ncbi:MAG: PadR family transcriptional regulator [Microbacterium sp.]
MQLKHAILGLLSIRPQSGYDLGGAFARSVAHFWHADQSQIYRTLTQLEADGALTTETIAQTARPNRRVHSLTTAGRAELDAWLRSPLEEERPKEPFRARLFFAATLGPRDVDLLLAQQEDRMTQILEQLKAIPEPTGSWEAELQSATLRAGIAGAEAELAWLTETRHRLAVYG